jgi:UDPglucose 6-dehydrogenase
VTPDRFVYGVAGPTAEADTALLEQVDAAPLATGTPRLVTDYATAELVKASANAFLATKISFINAMAEVCEAAGADVSQLADAIGHDDRIGGRFLKPGLGFGGGCLPKDIRAFAHRAEDLLRAAFAPVIEVPTPVVVTDFATAELVKVAANAFLATKISFINAMAEVCEATGGDVTKLSEALSYDDRIGGRFLHAGLGFGGGCLPKDIRAFMARAEELGVDQALSFLREVDAINLRRRARMVDLAREELGGAVQGARIAVLGAAFKPNSDDIRDSPALDVAAALHREGGLVTVYDPEALRNARVLHPELDYAETAIEAAQGADLVLHLTEWQEFRQMDPAVLGAVVAQRRILDGRNALDPHRWRDAGWTYRALGRP